MTNYVTNDSGTLIYCRGLQVRPKSSTTKITSRMLDGTYTIQQIGNAATALQVTVNVIDKTTFNGICETCAPIYIYHFNKRYQTIITSPEISWEPNTIGNDNFKGSFEAAVIEVVDR